MNQRSLPEDIEYRMRLKWGSEFQYTTRQHSVEDVTVDNYFHNISQRYLQPGDVIYVAIVSKDTWNRASFAVASMTTTDTVLTQLTDWTHPVKKAAKTPVKQAA